jgi:hypothetical protein
MVPLNALKDGRTAQGATQPLWQAMVDLGKDSAHHCSLPLSVNPLHRTPNGRLRGCEKNKAETRFKFRLILKGLNANAQKQRIGFSKTKLGSD